MKSTSRVSLAAWGHRKRSETDGYPGYSGKGVGGVRDRIEGVSNGPQVYWRLRVDDVRVRVQCRNVGSVPQFRRAVHSMGSSGTGVCSVEINVW
jgi:hypothetical protein